MTTFKINDQITIEAEYYETRSSWGHKAYLYVDGKKVDNKKITYYNRTWERYTFESILYYIVSKTKELTKAEKELCNQYIKNYEPGNPFKSIAMVAAMGEIFGQTTKEKNDWKTRMLKAGLEDKGLQMPDDWDELDEETKEARLNGAIASLK